MANVLAKFAVHNGLAGIKMKELSCFQSGHLGGHSVRNSVLRSVFATSNYEKFTARTSRDLVSGLQNWR